MVRTGRVIGTQDGVLEVCFERPEMCAQCGACMGHKPHEETVKIEGDAMVGDTVAVEMPDAKIVKVSLIAYIIPLIGLLLGLLIGQTLLNNDLWAAVIGLIGLAAGVLTARIFDRKLGAQKSWQPKLLSVYHPDNSTLKERES